MEKVPAIILSILLVVVLMGVIFFTQLAPDLDNRQDGVTTEMNGLDYTGNWQTIICVLVFIQYAYFLIRGSDKQCKQF